MGDPEQPQIVPGQSVPDQSAWKILIVDDEQQVHAVTKMALSGVTFDNRELEILSAYNGQDARSLLEKDRNIAVILLDVVMESDDAGLQLVDYIRNDLKNAEVRIIIRTGQAGMFPERAVVEKYDINGFREKTELTSDRLFSTVYTALSSYRDIHALREENARRRQVEKLQIEQTAELQKANESLQQFASLASHDMQEPLRKILIFGERLESQLGDEIKPEVQSYLERVRGSADRLNTLIGDLQSLSRLGAAKPIAESVNLEEILESVVNEYRSQIAQSGASIEHKNLPVIKADRSGMELLFQNLVSNALKYARTDQPLSLKFSARQIEGTDRVNEKCYEIRAEDNGIGIAEEYREKVFQNFFRLHGKEIAGTGIGLALCKQLVELHHGKIRVESNDQQGSTFVITLPINWT